MSNIINEEINKMLYLFGYKPGVVISEQTIPNELDEVGRPKNVNAREETKKIKDQIKDRVIKNNEIMFSEFETLLKKDKPFLDSLQPYYSQGFSTYKNVSPEDYDNIYNNIVEKATQMGDVTFQDAAFISKRFPNEYDDFKTLLTYDSPFINVSMEDKVDSIFKKAQRIKKLSKEERVYLTKHKPSVLRQLKPIVDKESGRKKYMTDDILLNKLIEIEDRVKEENEIRFSDYVYLNKNAPDILADLKPIWGKKRGGERLTDDGLKKRYKEIEEICKRIGDIYYSDYSFLQRKNPKLLEDLRVYWGKYTKKPKPVTPEPIVEPEPEITNTGIGVRGRPRKNISEPNPIVPKPFIEPEVSNTGIGRTRGGQPKYTDDEIRREASKYQTDGDFRKNNYGMWQVAYRRKMLDDLFPDRPKLGRPYGSNFYTDDEIRREASKYSSVPEFKKNSPSKVNIASNREMLDDLFPNRQIGSAGQPKYTDDEIRR